MYNIKVLSYEDVKQVSELKKVIECVKNVYISKSNDETEVWPTVVKEFDIGVSDLDIKSGYLKSMGIYGHKTVSLFTQNQEKGIPTLNGIINVFEDETGRCLGIMDGSYITSLRTGAAGALGAKYLARPESKTLMILGSGNQATYQIAATLTLISTIERVIVVNALDYTLAVDFVKTIKNRLEAEFKLDVTHVSFEAAKDIAIATGESDIIITVTPSRTPIIRKAWVRPGTHFSCVGSDMSGKEELDPEIMSNAKIFVDDKRHCIEVGEIEIPLKKGIINEDDIVGELGDLIAEKVEGRINQEDITIFDTTGIALLDIAAGKAVLESAEEKHIGITASL